MVTSANEFNRQVLEQVAKDGVTYKNLAKQMAEFILSCGSQPQEGSKFKCYLVLRDEGTELDGPIVARARAEGIPVIAYTPDINPPRYGVRPYLVELIPADQLPQE